MKKLILLLLPLMALNVLGQNVIQSGACPTSGGNVIMQGTVSGGNVLMANGSGVNVIGSNNCNTETMNSVKSNFAFWSDSTVSGAQLTDLSGNNRHAALTSNLVTDPGGELGSVLVQWTTGLVTNDADTVHSGSHSFKYITNAANNSGMRFQFFRTRPGEEVNWSIWVYRTTTAGLVLQVLNGDGSTNYQALKTPTVNTWTQYTGKFTDANGGGKAEIRAYVTSGATCFFFDDLSITITGKTNIGVIMANDSVLKSIDTQYRVFTSAGIPRTFRNDIGDITVENNLKMFTGGNCRYVLTPSIPDVTTRYVLEKNFIDNDWVYNSCEVVFTVGAGKTYANIQAAIDACTAPLATNRYRIDIYDNVLADAYAEFAKTIFTTFKNIFAVDKRYVYLSSATATPITIEGTLPNDCTDEQMGKAACGDFLYTGGARNLIIKKTNGRYAVHIDASTLASQDMRFYKCSFYNYGMDSVLIYRDAHGQPYPDSAGGVAVLTAGGITPLGMGMVTDFRVNFNSCYAYGIHPITCHSLIASGSDGYMNVYNTSFIAAPIRQMHYNPTAALMASMRIDGDVTTKISNCYLMKATLNSTITQTSSWNLYRKN
jgi:hypothetical protein